MKPLRRILLVLAIVPLLCAFDTPARTAIRPRVTDAVTGKPVSRATVVVCEADLRADTDADGYTRILTVPYLADNALASPDYGTLTLIAYADGYRPTVLVGCVTRRDTRFGPELPLFRIENDDSPLTVVETPPDAWVDDLVARYPRRAAASRSRS